MADTKMEPTSEKHEQAHLIKISKPQKDQIQLDRLIQDFSEVENTQTNDGHKENFPSSMYFDHDKDSEENKDEVKKLISISKSNKDAKKGKTGALNASAQMSPVLIDGIQQKQEASQNNAENNADIVKELNIAQESIETNVINVIDAIAEPMQVMQIDLVQE